MNWFSILHSYLNNINQFFHKYPFALYPFKYIVSTPKMPELKSLSKSKPMNLISKYKLNEIYPDNSKFQYTV